ncbi:septin 2 [Mortierella alpina]|nr:septin 2 [Mortierella alpina]
MDGTRSSAVALRFMLLGDVGVGKSSFVDTFAKTLSSVMVNDAVEELIPSPSTSATQSPPAIRLPGVHLKTGPVLHQETSPFEDPLGLLQPKVNVPARELTFVTLPGYSSTINPSTILSMTDDYLNHHLHTVTSIFSPAIPSSQLAWFLIAGSRAHFLPTCAFYFVLYELKPIDILYMKMIHERVNLVPVITKADTLSQNELWVLKKRMLRQLKLNGIKIHTFGTDMETIESMTSQRQWGAPPFVVSTRQDSSGQLVESELKRLVDLCLYERVRHLQEDAARKVITWKKEFGPSGNPSKTRVEKVWSERDVPTPVRTASVRAPAPVASVASMTTAPAPAPVPVPVPAPVPADVPAAVPAPVAPTVVAAVPTVADASPSSAVSPASNNPFSNNPYLSHIDTQSAVEAHQLNQATSPTQYAPPPPPSLLQQQQQQQSYVSASPYNNPTLMTPNVPFTPPPSLGKGPLAGQVNFGLGGANYAPPPSFTNGSHATYTAPPLNLNKPLPANGHTPPAAGTTNGLYTPAPSISTATPYNAPTVYSPPPRTTSNQAVSSASASQARLHLMRDATGMAVDKSTRPSVIMDENSINTVHAQIQAHESAAESQAASADGYGQASTVNGSSDDRPTSPTADTLSRTSTNADGNEVKVEIPNSITSYHPAPSETTLELSSAQPTTTMMQPHGSFILPAPVSFPAPGTFFIPPTDIYAAGMVNGSAGTGGVNEYGEAIPDIWEAAELGDLATVQMHLNNGVSPDQRNNSRSTLLHRTAWQGVKPYAVMNLLISYGANVNLTNENGNTVLQNVLMKHDDPSLIKLLLDNGAEAMIPNKEGMNTLEVAALFNKLESAKYLLENDLSSSEPQSIMNALQRARSPDKKVMKALLKSWQGKEGERKRMELMDKLRGHVPTAMNDGASVRSFETSKGDAKTSKWLKLKF